MKPLKWYHHLIVGLVFGGMIGASGAFEYCARKAEKNQVTDHAIITNQQDQIRELQHTIVNMESAMATQHENLEVALLQLDQARAADESANLIAQQNMLNLVRLNSCEVAAKRLAAQQAQMPPQSQQIVAALLKAFLR